MPSCSMRARRAAIALSAWAAACAPASGQAPGSAASPAVDPAALARVRADEQQRVEIFARAAASVVCIFDDESRGGGGSGVLISPQGYGLTNVHVVAGFLESRSGFGGLQDGKLYPLRVIGVDPGGDIALFRLSGRDTFEFAPLGDSDALHVGQWVAALGNPFILADDFTPTVTLGVISGLHRYQEGQNNLLEYADCIQVSTSINPGNSGGPLFNLRAEVIGINGRASFEERGRVNVGVGYAVTINQIKRFLPALLAGRFCEHGTLGATVTDEDGKLIFNAVQEVSPAERAGIELGDELLTFTGRPVRTANQFNNMLAILPADWPVSIGVRRGPRELQLHTRLERLPVRQPTPWLIDWQQNHSYARELFAAARRQGRLGPDRVPVLLRGALRSSAGAEPAAVELRWQDGVAELLRIAGVEHRIAELNLAGPTPLQKAPEQLAVLAHGLAPLLGRPNIGIGWEVRGADEVHGRIVAVIEHRPEDTRGQPTLRWKIDAQTGELLAIARLGDALSELGAWRAVAGPATPEGGPSRHWQFDDAVLFEIGELEFAPAPSAAGKEPQ